MKKLFTLALIAIASISASAEGYYAGGNVGFWHDGDKGTNTLSILPEVGKVFSSKFSVGATLGYQYQNTYGTGYSVNLFEINPYVRYTFYRSSNDLVNLFVDGTVGVGLGWGSYDGGSTSTAVIYQIGAKPGIAINLTKKFSLVAHIGMIGYQGGNNASGVKGKGGVNLDATNCSFGFYYHF